MIGLDTNVLVRYITADDEQQSAIASRVIEQAAVNKKPIYLNHIVLCELVWVLCRAYQLDKATIVDVLEKILATKQFEIEDKDIVSAALNDYRNTKCDFADALIGAKNHRAGCHYTLSFDKATSKLMAFKII